MCQQFTKGEKEDADNENDMSCSDANREIEDTNGDRNQTNKKEIDQLKGRVKSLEYQHLLNLEAIAERA